MSLRVVLDQVNDVVDPDVAEAGREMTRALVSTSPRGCDVTAIVPSGAEAAATTAVDGLAGVTKAPLTRAKLAVAWQLGIARGIGGGLIHAPSAMAPLVRHDRVHENDQTVVTLWDLCAWEVADELPRNAVRWHHAMLRRAERHADAVVVPTHAMAERLGEISALGGRVRVIPGAAPAGFAVPSDAVGRRRALGLPDELIVVAGGRCDDAAIAAALSAVAAREERPAVALLDVPQEQHPRVRDVAAASGLGDERIHVHGFLEAADRGAVWDAALALVAPSSRTAFPWRVVEALALGVPVVAAASPVHEEVLLEGGVVAQPDELADSLESVLASEDDRRRFSVRALDRGRAFSWRDHADRVWQLHAEL